MILIVLDRDGTIIEEVSFLGKEQYWKDQTRLKENTIKILTKLDKHFASKKIVVTNQTGVARGFLSERRVKEINEYVETLLKIKNIYVDVWEYCPFADKKYAKETGYYFVKRYVKENSGRKPSTQMIEKSLKKIKMSPCDFDNIIVFGDRPEDEGLAKNIPAIYIDVNNKDLLNWAYINSKLRNNLF